MNLLAWILVIALSVSFSDEARAWSAPGHMQIAEAAFVGLSKQEQGALSSVLAAGPWVGKGNAPAQAHLARAAVWPDRIRDTSLQQIFQRHGSGRVPPALRSYRMHDTAQWHFVNARFLTPAGELVPASSRAQSCPPAAYGQLYDVWVPLLNAFTQANDVRDKAIILAFIMHMGGDAYQPLHTFAALDQHCDHDRGGNGYCVESAQGKRCKTNLHQLWDRGFGVFDSKWQRDVQFNGDIRDLYAQRLKDVVHIYPVSAESVHKPEYQRMAAETVRSQSVLAAAHLRAVLRELAHESVRDSEVNQ